MWRNKKPAAATAGKKEKQIKNLPDGVIIPWKLKKVTAHLNKMH